MKRGFKGRAFLPAVFCLVLTMLSGNAAGAAGSGSVRAADQFELTEQWVNYNADTTKLSLDGADKITFTATQGEVGGAYLAKNILLYDVPDDADFTATVKIENEDLKENYQMISLAAYANDKRIAATMRRYHSGLGGNVFAKLNYNGASQNKYDEDAVADTDRSDAAWLKLERKGNSFIHSYSYDGSEFSEIGKTEETDGLVGQDLKIAIYTGGGNAGGPFKATVQDFTLNGEAVPFCKNAEEDDGDGSVYLSDWDWLSATVGWKEPVKDGCTECSSIRLMGQDGQWHTYEKGIGAHAPSELVYDIEGRGVLRFQSDVGVNKTGGSCGFTVLTDVSEEPLYHTETVLKAGDPVQHVDVEIPAEATRLILKTDNGGDNDTSDHSVWAGAKLILDASVQHNLHKVTLSAPIRLETGATASASVSGELVSGEEADLTDAQIVYSSSDPEILSVGQNGSLKGEKDGMCTLSVTVSKDGITKSAQQKILVGEAPELNAELSSPDGSLTAGFTLDEAGTAQYILVKDGETAAETSDLGLVTNVDDFTKGMVFISQSPVTEGVDDYDLTGAKVTHVHKTYKETTFTFWGEKGTELKVTARMYDEGLAFRYSIDGQGMLSVSSEETTVRIPDGSTVHAMVYHPQHEGYAVEYTLEELTDDDYDTPMLYETPEGIWGLIGNGAVSGSDYCVARFAGDGKGNVQYVLVNSGNPVVTEMPFESPWRFIVSGSAGDINLNTMAENLSPDCEGDFSWVKPGVTSWTWLNGDACNDLDTYKDYVDLSVKMGWQYLLMDEGWQLGGKQGQSGQSGWYGYGEWFDELSEYAQENGIGLLAWAHNKDLQDKYTVTKDHSSELCQLLDEWKSKGIVGIKPDFFYGGTQSTIAWMDTLIQETAHHHMLLDLHGCAQPSGERRTYPHLLSREAVFGGEQVYWDNSHLTAHLNCVLPFTRNAVGPMDYTPMFSLRFTGHNQNRDHNFTVGQMAAMPVVFETGIQCLADKPASYLGSPAEIYFQGMPAEWEESVVLEADPGDYVTIARKAHSGDWYVGAMCDAKRSAHIDLSFLDKGHTYYAVICKDETKAAITSEYQKVTCETKLDIPMLEAGGAAIRIMYNEPELPDTLELTQSSVEMQAYTKETLTATALKEGEAVEAAIMWNSDDESVVTVKEGVLTALKPGTATVTASVNVWGSTLEASCKVKVTRLLEDGWEIMNADAQEHWSLGSDSKVTIDIMNGEFYYQNKTPKETARNIFLHDVTDTDFEISVTLDFKPGANYQTAGLIIYRDGAANFAATRRYHGSFGGKVLGAHGANVNKFTENHVAEPSEQQETIDLKIAKSGTQLTSYYSLDGRKTWTKYNDIQWVSFDGAAPEELKVGLYTGNNADTEAQATFTDFSIKYPEDQQETVLPFINTVISVTGVELNEDAISLNIGEDKMLTAEVKPENATDKSVVWSSSDDSVATVSDSGKVLAVGEGTADITATSVDGGFTDTCRVTVKKAHTHVYDQEIASEEYLKAEATCTEAAVYYKSCSCGEKGTETFVSGSASGHIAAAERVGEEAATCTKEGYTGDVVCKECGEILEEGEVTEKIPHHFENEVCTECGTEDPDKPTEPMNPDKPADPEEPTGSGSPQSGDCLSPIVFTELLILSAAGMLAFVIILKRRKGNR